MTTSLSSQLSAIETKPRSWRASSSHPSDPLIDKISKVYEQALELIDRAYEYLGCDQLHWLASFHQVPVATHVRWEHPFFSQATNIRKNLIEETKQFRTARPFSAETEQTVEKLEHQFQRDRAALLTDRIQCDLRRFRNIAGEIAQEISREIQSDSFKDQTARKSYFDLKKGIDKLQRYCVNRELIDYDLIEKTTKEVSKLFHHWQKTIALMPRRAPTLLDELKFCVRHIKAYREFYCRIGSCN